MTNIDKLTIAELRNYIDIVCDTFQIKDKPKSKWKDELQEALIAILTRYGYGGLWNTKYIDVFLRIYNLDDKQLSTRLLLLTHKQDSNNYYIDDDIINMINQAEMEYIDNLHITDFDNEMDSDNLFYPDGEYDSIADSFHESDFALSDPSVDLQSSSELAHDLSNATNKSKINNNQNTIFSSIKSAMNEEHEYINPLEQLIAHTITLQDLIYIYNRYAPRPTTSGEVMQAAEGDRWHL